MQSGYKALGKYAKDEKIETDYKQDKNSEQSIDEPFLDITMGYVECDGVN